MFVIHGVGLPM